MLIGFDIWLKEAKKSDNTRFAYLRDIQSYLEYKGTQDATSELVTAYLDYLVEIGRTGSTVKRVLAALRTYYDYAVSIGTEVSNPARMCEQPEFEVSLTLAPPSNVEVQALLECVSRLGSPRDIALLSLLCLTGATVSEIQALNIGDVDIRMNWVSYGNRKIVLPTSVGQALRALYMGKHRLRDEDALFVSRLGARLTRQGIWLICKRWVEKSDVSVDLSPRLLRRGYAAHLLNEGESHKTVKTRMGYAELACVPF